MSEEEINIAIAQACGWSNDDIKRGCTLRGVSFHVPDYCNVLNVMHEAEKVLAYEQAEQFEDELCDICDMENRNKEYPLPFRFAVVHATARQRAEAFLKTIGKWEGGPQ